MMLLTSTCVAADAPSSGAPTAPAAPAALYAQRCAACHDQIRPDIPSRRALAARSPAFIVDKLVFGSMQSSVLGLSDAQIDALAAWLVSCARDAPRSPG